MIRFVGLLLANLFALLGVYADDWFQPETGDLVVWAGDSITHQCGYTQYLENFLYTRFHDKRLRFANAGIKGDAAADLLDRFDQDIAWREPRWVTILLGMNDGRYGPFDADNFAAYQTGVGGAIDRIEALGAQAILMSPTMFDHEQYQRRFNDSDFRFARLNAYAGYNDKLIRYGDWLRTVANQREAPFIDIGDAMLIETMRRRRDEPGFTLSPDSIHPDPSGMALMAVEMAQSFAGDRSLVNRVVVDLHSNGEVQTEGEVVVDRFADARLTATITPRYLPWAIPASGFIGPEPWKYMDDPSQGFRAALQRIPINDDLLVVRGLPRGSYQVRMNGLIVLTASDQQLSEGVYLQDKMNAPGYRQSLKLAELNALRNDRAVRPYRDLQGRLKSVRRREGSDSDAFRAALESVRNEMKPLQDYAKALEDRIHSLAEPKAYRLEIRPSN